MCGRFVMEHSRYDLAEEFAVDEVVADEMPTRYNIAPSQLVFAVANSADGTTRKLGAFRWGLVPHWAKSPSMSSPLNNARAETITAKPSFREAIAKRRCIIPASGYYEWRLPRPEVGDKKTPFYFHRPDHQPLALAGIWEYWRDAEGHVLRTSAVITTSPNAAIAAIHDRMPVILEQGTWQRWLAPGTIGSDELESLLVAAPIDLLAIEQVSDRVNSARNDDPDLIVPVEADATPSLLG